MLDNLYRQKTKYERLINSLNINYNLLNNNYYNLTKLQKVINNTFQINDVYYNKNVLDNIIIKINNDRELVSKLLIIARKEYYVILNKISSMGAY